MSQDKIRLGILGCGAITRIEHLPAALAHGGIELTALVDTDVRRANALGEASRRKCSVGDDFRPILSQVDAFINALPNHLHAPVTLEILRAGVHVLCEKPLATNASDARACAEAAEQNKVVLAVGMNRRFSGSHKLLHLILQEKLLGGIENYDCQYGGAWDWKSASGFYLSRAQAGGGALIDFGVHLLDSLIDWFGPVTGFDYQDDNWGSGLEANAILDLKHEGRHGAISGQVRVSRTFPLKNRLLIRGSEAEGEIANADPDAVMVHRLLQGQRLSETIRLAGFSNTSSFYKQLDNFVQSIRGEQKPEVDGFQAARVLQLVEDCYLNARRIPEPWSEVGSSRHEVLA